MPKPLPRRIIVLAVIGSVSAAFGQKILARVPDSALVISGLIAAAAVWWSFRSARRRPGASETMAQTLAVAMAGAIAGVGGERMVDRAPMTLAAAVAALVMLLVALLRRRGAR